MKIYGFYSRGDSTKERVACVVAGTRLQAARFFAWQKNLKLKEFLQIYSIQ